VSICKAATSRHRGIPKGQRNVGSKKLNGGKTNQKECRRDQEYPCKMEQPTGGHAKSLNNPHGTEKTQVEGE